MDEQIKAAQEAVNNATTPEELQAAKSRLLAIQMHIQSQTGQASIMGVDAALHQRRAEYAAEQNRLADANLRRSQDRLNKNIPL